MSRRSEIIVIILVCGSIAMLTLSAIVCAAGRPDMAAFCMAGACCLALYALLVNVMWLR